MGFTCWMGRRRAYHGILARLDADPSPASLSGLASAGTLDEDPCTGVAGASKAPPGRVEGPEEDALANIRKGEERLKKMKKFKKSWGNSKRKKTRRT